jgi:apolipoprotein D and lipocalin family protein
MFLSFIAAAFAREPLQTVPELDLDRYEGTWYEIARLPNRFEKGCEGVTATYAVREDGKVDVTNRCRRDGPDGREKVARGVARRPDPAVPGVLQVSFFGPFWGDYQVIALEPEYRWAVVGSPDRKYLWVLARSPSMVAADRQAALSAASAQGFDTKALLFPEQPPAARPEIEAPGS